MRYSHSGNLFPPIAEAKLEPFGVNKMQRATKITAIMLSTLLLSTLLSGCRTRSFLSTKQEIELGQQGMQQVEQQYRVETATADADRVREIGERLLQHIHKRPIPYSFHVIDSNQINAFSLPGGPVFVCRGLMDMIGNDNDALACVIGHELGHINARHVARTISSDILNSTLIAVLFPNPNAQAGASIVNDVLGLHYSRQEEYEADWRGLSYAHAAGYNPEGMVRFFGKLERLSKLEGSAGPAWLQDHPLTKDRIARAEWIIEHNDYRYGKQ